MSPLGPRCCRRPGRAARRAARPSAARGRCRRTTWRADRVLVVGVPGLAGRDVDPERHAAAVGAGRALRDRRALGAGRPLHHLPARRLGHARARATAPATRARSSRSRRCRCPRAAARRSGDAAPATAARPTGRRVDTRLSLLRPGGAGRQRRPDRARAHRRPGRRGRGDRPLRRRARRAGPGRRLQHAWSAGPPRWPSPAPGRAVTVRDALPADDGELAALLDRLPADPGRRSTQLTDAGRPGRRRHRRRHRPAARQRRCSAIDAAVGRLRAAVAAARATRCCSCRASPRSTTAARSCTWAWPPGPAIDRRAG